MSSFHNHTWAFVPGPPELDGTTLSHMVEVEPVKYSPGDFAKAFMAVSGAELVNSGSPDWWSWKAAWIGDEDAFEVGMTLFETSPPHWGGSPIEGAQSAREVLSVWRDLARKLPGVYLHNEDCEMFSLEAFQARFLDEGTLPTTSTKS